MDYPLPPIPEFEFYDPHADLLDLAIWSMYHWIKQDVERHAAEQAAAAAPASNVSNASSVTGSETQSASASNVSNASSVTDSETQSAPASNVSNASSVTGLKIGLTAARAPRLVRPEETALLAQFVEPPTEAFLDALQYFFSASDIYALMHAEALRRQRADLAERLTPASVGRLLSELGLQRARTPRGRRFRLTHRTFTDLLSNFIYVFHPEDAKTALTRRWRE